MRPIANMQKALPYVAPLWPAGHLPLKGGDWQLQQCRPFCNINDWQKPSGRLISPLEGEMSGRTEGGAKEGRIRGVYR